MPAVEEHVEHSAPPSPGDGHATGRVYPWERTLLARLRASLGEAPVRLTLWNGESVGPARCEPVAEVLFRERRAFWKTLLNPDLHFGNAYTTGQIEIRGDLVRLLEAIFSHASSPEMRRARPPRGRRNTLSGSRDNIHHHYDIGNDFYRLWLDERMVYTCAYFEHADMSLEAAQRAKMDHVCRKLRLQPGEQVIEAGCGWGALALHMAAHYGVHVRAYNISHEQVLYARDAAKREGLSDRVEFVEADYRRIDGRCDAFASVGMLEHVGVEHYRQLGEVIDRCLAPSGRGLIHTIGRHRPIPMSRWLTTRVFPGAEFPTLREMMDLFEPYDFAVLDVENLRLHYAHTLRHWLARFEGVADRVAEMFDERFVRAWRLYLAASMAAFTSGWVQLFQVLFNRHSNNDVPWTRAHLHDPTARRP